MIQIFYFQLSSHYVPTFSRRSVANDRPFVILFIPQQMGKMEKKKEGAHRVVPLRIFNTGLLMMGALC